MPPSHTRTNDTDAGLRHQEIGGIRFLERRGTGPTFVFLHGIGSNSDSFEPVFKTLPEGPRLIAWNAPGYLTSAPLTVAKPTAADYAGALEHFFDRLGLDEATIIGHSLGTLIAVAFALRAPTRVSSVVLAASAQGYGIDANAPLPPNATERLKDLERLGAEAFAETRAPRLVFDPEHNPSVVASVRQEMARINSDGYGQAVHMLASGNLAASVAQLRQKPGFIIGAEDQVTPIAQTTAAMRAWTEVHGDTPRCITIERAGHAVYVQAPQAFCAALFELAPDLQTPMPSHAEGELHGR